MKRTSLTRTLYRTASISAKGRAVRRSVTTGSPKPIVANYIRRRAHRALGKALRGLLG